MYPAGRIAAVDEAVAVVVRAVSASLGVTRIRDPVAVAVGVVAPTWTSVERVAHTVAVGVSLVRRSAGVARVGSSVSVSVDMIVPDGTGVHVSADPVSVAVIERIVRTRIACVGDPVAVRVFEVRRSRTRVAIVADPVAVAVSRRRERTRVACVGCAVLVRVLAIVAERTHVGIRADAVRIHVVECIEGAHVASVRHSVAVGVGGVRESGTEVHVSAHAVGVVVVVRVKRAWIARIGLPIRVEVQRVVSKVALVLRVAHAIAIAIVCVVARAAVRDRADAVEVAVRTVAAALDEATRARVTRGTQSGQAAGAVGAARRARGDAHAPITRVETDTVSCSATVTVVVAPAAGFRSAPVRAVATSVLTWGRAVLVVHTCSAIQSNVDARRLIIDINALVPLLNVDVDLCVDWTRQVGAGRVSWVARRVRWGRRVGRGTPVLAGIGHREPVGWCIGAATGRKHQRKECGPKEMNAWLRLTNHHAGGVGGSGARATTVDGRARRSSGSTIGTDGEGSAMMIADMPLAHKVTRVAVVDRGAGSDGAAWSRRGWPVARAPADCLPRSEGGTFHA